MRVTRRWFAALLLALGLLPGVERVLLAHVHGSASPVLGAASAGDDARGASGEAWLDCAACQARATLDALTIDAHPERHGAAPAAAPLPELRAFPSEPRAETPPVRGPPTRIV